MPKFTPKKRKSKKTDEEVAKERYEKKNVKNLNFNELTIDCWEDFRKPPLQRKCKTKEEKENQRKLKYEDVREKWFMYKYTYSSEWRDIEYIFLPITVKNEDSKNWLMERSKIWTERFRRENERNDTPNNIFRREGLPTASKYKDGMLKIWTIQEIVGLLKSSDDHSIKILWRPNVKKEPLEWNFPNFGIELKNDRNISYINWTPDWREEAK